MKFNLTGSIFDSNRGLKLGDAASNGSKRLQKVLESHFSRTYPQYRSISIFICGCRFRDTRTVNLSQSAGLKWQEIITFDFLHFKCSICFNRLFNNQWLSIGLQRKEIHRKWLRQISAVNCQWSSRFSSLKIFNNKAVILISTMFISCPTYWLFVLIRCKSITSSTTKCEYECKKICLSRCCTEDQTNTSSTKRSSYKEF